MQGHKKLWEKVSKASTYSLKFRFSVPKEIIAVNGGAESALSRSCDVQFRLSPVRVTTKYVSEKRAWWHTFVLHMKPSFHLKRCNLEEKPFMYLFRIPCNIHAVAKSLKKNN